MGITLFSIAWVGIFYAFNSAIAKSLVRIEIKTALLYISAVVFFGVFAEVLIDSLYAMVFGAPLWEYHLLPIHNAYTSYYSLVIWSLYGFYLYLMHQNLDTKFGLRSRRAMAAVVAIEALIIETLFNLTFILFFHQYIFYYLPSDLWHLTSVQAIPIYFLAGIIIVSYVRATTNKPLLFSAVNVTAVAVLVFFTH